MAQQEQDLTFITEDIPGATSFIQSGKGLRLSYVIRRKAKFITDMLLGGIEDPNNITQKQWQSEIEKWKEDAKVQYPDEGDYKIWLVDVDGVTPIPLGTRVEFIGNDIRETPGGQPCTEYTLDLSAVVVDDPSTFVVEVVYEDCFLRAQEVSGIIADLDGLSICVGRGTPIVNVGVLTSGSICDLNFGNPECSEYTWDLTGLPPGDLVTLGLKDCSGVDTKIEDTPANLGTIVTFCAQEGSPTSVVGVITYVGLCTI